MVSKESMLKKLESLKSSQLNNFKIVLQEPEDVVEDSLKMLITIRFHMESKLKKTTLTKPKTKIANTMPKK